MRKTEYTTTLTCDKCNKVVSNLRTLFRYDPKAAFRHSSEYVSILDLCDECWRKAMAYLEVSGWSDD